MICRLCGIDVDPDFAEPSGACPDCLEAEADDNAFDKNLRGAGMRPMGRYSNVDDGEL